MSGIEIKIPARVVDVIDGDTIEIEISRRARIRLLDCWAPETRSRDADEKAAGLVAKDYLESVADGEHVVVTIPIEADKRFGQAMSFDRILGRVELVNRGRDLSEIMVESGHATKTKGGES